MCPCSKVPLFIRYPLGLSVLGLFVLVVSVVSVLAFTFAYWKCRGTGDSTLANYPTGGTGDNTPANYSGRDTGAGDDNTQTTVTQPVSLL